MTLIMFYNRVGGDLTQTLRRLPGEDFVRKFLLRYPDDPSFAQLWNAVENSDWQTAFQAAHTVKGIAQKLGLEKLYQAANALTEALRGDRELEDRSLLQAIEAAQAEVLAALNELDPS